MIFAARIQCTFITIVALILEITTANHVGFRTMATLVTDAGIIGTEQPIVANGVAITLAAVGISGLGVNAPVGGETALVDGAELAVIAVRGLSTAAFGVSVVAYTVYAQVIGADIVVIAVVVG